MSVGLALAAWGLAALLEACGQTFPVEHSEPLIVRILNGKSGKPLPRARLTLAAGYTERDLGQRLWRDEAVTDAEGEARVPRVLGNFPFLQVHLAKAKLCQDTSRGEAYSVERVRSTGLNAPNHCGVIDVAETPRVLVVFIRSRREPDVPVQTPAAENRLDFAAGDHQTAEPNELSRNPAPPSRKSGYGPGRALAHVAASVGVHEVEAAPGWEALPGRNEINVLVGRQTGFSEMATPVVEGTVAPTESYETMCRPED